MIEQQSLLAESRVYKQIYIRMCTLVRKAWIKALFGWRTAWSTYRHRLEGGHTYVLKFTWSEKNWIKALDGEPLGLHTYRQQFEERHLPPVHHWLLVIEFLNWYVSITMHQARPARFNS